MCGWFCVRFTDFLFKSKSLTDLFSRHGFENIETKFLIIFLKSKKLYKKPYVYETKQLPTNLDNAAQFRLSKTKEMENYLIAEMNEKEKISKVLNKYIT